jgi:hypothetical protein
VLAAHLARNPICHSENFRMNTGYGRYGATYNMVGFSCFNEELSLLPKNPTEAKLRVHRVNLQSPLKV